MVVILLTVSNTDILEKLFDLVQKILLCWGLQKKQREDTLNYLEIKIK